MPTPPGYPASFASFAFRLDCPPSLPTTSVDQNAKAYSHPHSSSLPFHTNRALIWPFHHMGGKDNPPPSVIYIVHQHRAKGRRFSVVRRREEDTVQHPNAILTTLSQMARKPEVKFDKLFQKLYNIELWLLAYQSIAPEPGNMTPGVDGKTIDGAGMKLIQEAIAELKASRYKPIPVRRVYIPKPNGKQRPLGIPGFREKLLGTVLKLILEAIYEPTFSENSHGFRPGRSCHTALEAIQRDMQGVRWWVEGDIKGY